eukprot:952226-Prorocentrum_lima.AAC.1
MQQLKGQGETHDEGHDEGYQGALEEGAFHEPYNGFKLPAGPSPGRGFHDPISNFKPPPKWPESRIGSHLKNKQTEELDWMTNLH